MRVHALEEHFSLPHLLARIPVERILARGNPAPPHAPKLLARTQPQLSDLGSGRLADMDANGITMQVLSWAGPGADLLFGNEAIAWAIECNDELAAAIAEHPDRFAGFAHLPVTEPEAAATELERTVTQHGFKGAMINGMTLPPEAWQSEPAAAGRFLDHPSFEPLLTMAETLDVPLYLHPNLPPLTVREAYFGSLPEGMGFLLGAYGFGWHAEVAVHVLRLALSGTLDRHPRLRLIVGHSGEYLPMALARTENLLGAEVAGRLARPISEQLRSQLWITTAGQFTLPPLRAALDVFGLDHVLFSVDHPYNTNAEGRAFIDSLPLAPADLARLCHGNAEALLKLKAPEQAGPQRP